MNWWNLYYNENKTIKGHENDEIESGRGNSLPSTSLQVLPV